MKRLAVLVAAAMFLTTAGWGLAREAGRPHAARRTVPRVAAREMQRETTRETDRDAAKRRRQAALLPVLWPGRVAVLTGEAGADVDWAEADRLYVWMQALFAGAGLSGVMPVAISPPGNGHGAWNAANVPGQGGDSGIGDAFEAEGPEVFAPPQGGLSWPASGRVAAAFAPTASPPRQGMVLAVPENTPVMAAADGRVAFTGAFKGLGRVLILSHGGRRHTVYACLGALDAAEGETVTRGTVLGQAGYCGPIHRPGVYFELRFREKALNPAEWLAVRR